MIRFDASVFNLVDKAKNIVDTIFVGWFTKLGNYTCALIIIGIKKCDK